MKWIAILVLGFSLAVAGQTAKVVQLSPDEARQAKALHDEQDSVAKKIAEFDQAIRTKYLSAPKNEEGHTNTYSLNGKWIWVRIGWGNGAFEYSEDFKFIVPLVLQTPPTGTCQSMFCGVTLTPSYQGQWITN